MQITTLSNNVAKINELISNIFCDKKGTSCSDDIKQWKSEMNIRMNRILFDTEVKSGVRVNINSILSIIYGEIEFNTKLSINYFSSLRSVSSSRYQEKRESGFQTIATIPELRIIFENELINLDIEKVIAYDTRMRDLRKRKEN